MREAARRTGLAPHVLRAWERRYQAVSPDRSQGRHRYYSEEQLERLVLLRRATEAGRSISQIASLDDEELRRLLGDSAEPRGMDEVAETSWNPLLSAVESLDAQEVDRLLDQILKHADPQRQIPYLETLLDRFGAEFDAGRLRLWHLTSMENALTPRLDSLARGAAPPRNGPTLLAFSLVDWPGPLAHCKMALWNWGCASAGFRTIVLGASRTAVDEFDRLRRSLTAAVRELDSDGVVVSTTGLDDAEAQVLEEALREIRSIIGPRTPMVVIGARTRRPVAGATITERFDQLECWLRRLRSGNLVEEPTESSATAAEPRTETIAVRQLPLSRQAREDFAFDAALITDRGGLRVDEAHRLRAALRGAATTDDPSTRILPSRLVALGHLVDHFHRRLATFRQLVDPTILRQSLDWLADRHGQTAIEAALRALSECFPTQRPVVSREEQLKRLWQLRFLTTNPALGAELRLFDDRELEAASGYRQLIDSLHRFFRQQPVYPGDGRGLFELLNLPVLRGRESLSAQLDALRDLELRLEPASVGPILVALDLLHEADEELRQPSFSPPEPVECFDFSGLSPRDLPSREEADWMAGLTLVAKHVHVWLHQLGEQVGRPIRRLDEIPATELDRLAEWGFTGIWLIGTWRRSQASERLKHLTGHDEAMASAYAVDRYEIDPELGGRVALDRLREMAEDRGLRLGCDIVPNHMGLDSEWLSQHPERFLSLDHCPFPDYRFTGPDLTPYDSVMSIQVEDGYLDESRAAVVFRRTDRESGEVRYVYHGNDGVNVPWNDTAQLDYLRPEVRDAMLDVLVSLAKQFPIVRVDAAMTLVKRHIQRLWHPLPGQGGAIPSRTGAGVSAEELDRRMPVELWRQAVDRIEQEAPGSLLLAEGFWMMETYFLSALGMHRVYNAAFRHFLRDGRNGALRRSLENILEFEPRVLGRFLHYLTSPDDPSAAATFGKGDQYFASCVLLASLPGVPLFGHGQFEGLLEQYGMDYRSPRFEESSQDGFIRRHEREIVPLLNHRPALFSDPRALTIFRFRGPADAAEAPGPIVDDVFVLAYRKDGDHALVVVHNRQAKVLGTIAESAPRRGPDGEIQQWTSLAEFLGVEREPNAIWQFHESLRGLHVEVQEHAEFGFALSLGPFDYRVFTRIELKRP